MTEENRTDLGEANDIDVVTQLVDVAGLSLVDVGCGAGMTTRALADLGATMLGLEPDPIQAAKNRDAAPADNVTLQEAGAQAMPVDDNAVDGVFFFRSLHHVPDDLMDAALAEAARVLRPDGFLFVVEPAMTGSHYQMMRPFHDETRVRTLAQEALERTASGLFKDCRKYTYMMYPKHESFDAAKAFFSSMSFNDIDADKIDQPSVRAAFEAAKTDDGHVFDQPFLVNVYRGVR